MSYEQKRVAIITYVAITIITSGILGAWSWRWFGSAATPEGSALDCHRRCDEAGAILTEIRFDPGPNDTYSCICVYDVLDTE